MQHFNTSDGLFVEVGAFDGESFSNTSGLADLGWQGIYIEPVPEYMNRCRARHLHNNVIFEQCAISNTSEVRSIHVVGGLSTMREDIHDAHKNTFDLCHFENEVIINVQTTRLDSILSNHNVSKHFDLLVVDVEGYEQQVFESFNMTEYRPKMMIVELSDNHQMFKDYPEIQNSHLTVRNHIINQGYKEVYADSINTIFVDAI
jgi:FkbM family methyltransferase